MTATSLLSVLPVVLAAGLLLPPVVLRLLTAAAVMDRPNERSSHTVPTPRGGGIAVVAAAGVGLLLSPPTRAIAVPLLLFAAIGLLEDLRGVGVTARLLLQAAAGSVSAVLLLPASLPAPATAALVVAVAVWLTGYANAFNFMDGVNGISAVHAALAGVAYAVTGAWYGVPELTTAGAVVAAAAVTFLPWNAGRARMFLGDVGSYGLGGVLGALAGYGLWRGAPVELVAAPLALYLADTGWTLARRCYRGEPWYRAHRSHAYQRLTGLGWSHQRVTAVTAGVAALVCGCAALAARGPLPVRLGLDAAALGLLLLYLASPRLLAALRREPARSQERSVYV